MQKKKFKSRRFPNNRKKIKIGFDLDGVIIDKPPFVPNILMEKLVRRKANSELIYRYPNTAFERFIRWLSHYYIFRPPIEDKLEFINKLCEENKYELYIISSRYSFLKGRTMYWLKKRGLGGCFKEIHINLQNLQPHLFKEEKLKDLKIDYFIDDDLPLINYLNKKNLKTKIIYTVKGRKLTDNSFI